MWVLQPPTLQNELPQASFPCISKATTAKFLQESFKNHDYKKVKQRFSNKKEIVKNLFKVNEKKIRATWDWIR